MGAARHRYTVEEYHKMGEAGVFDEDDRAELIDGEVVETAPVGLRHVRCVNRLNVLLVRFADSAGRYEVNVRNPINQGEHGEPLPDLALVEGPPAERLPGPGEVVLVVEVSDATVAYDHRIKLPLYANAGILEAWIVDLNEDRLEAHPNPGPRGYGLTSRFGRGERVASATAAGLACAVDQVLPPR